MLLQLDTQKAQNCGKTSALAECDHRREQINQREEKKNRTDKKSTNHTLRQPIHWALVLHPIRISAWDCTMAFFDCCACGMWWPVDRCLSQAVAVCQLTGCAGYNYCQKYVLCISATAPPGFLHRVLYWNQQGWKESNPRCREEKKEKFIASVTHKDSEIMINTN